MLRRVPLLVALVVTTSCSAPKAQDAAVPIVPAEPVAAPVAEASVPIIPVGDQIPIRVVKSPTCGCCAAWVDYMKENGFAVTVEEREVFTELKRANGVTPELESCHTAFAGDLVIEGHVPAEMIKKVLREKPAGVKGLAVPGMPVGSPGMEGGTPQRYTVFTFDATGKSSVYSKQ